MTLLLLLAAAAAQAPAGTPEGFIQRLYASYNRTDFSPFKHPERVFAPRLLAAINDDRRLNGDEVGYIGGDPVCQCQDAAGLRATITKVVVQDRNHARVRVSISLQGYAPRPVMFTLVRTRAGWRIADIVDPLGTSLLLGIETSNRRLREQSR